jgi:hypothetical protein
MQKILLHLSVNKWDPKEKQTEFLQRILGSNTRKTNTKYIYVVQEKFTLRENTKYF